MLKQEIAKISLIILAVIAILSAVGAVTLFITSAKAQTSYYGQECTDTSSTSVKIDESGDECSYRFTAQDSKTVAKIHIWIDGAGTPPAVDVGLKADDGENPTGDYLSTAGSITPGTSWAWKVADIADHDITKDTVYHIVIKSADATSDNYVSLRESAPHHKKLSYDGTDDTNLNTLDYSVSATSAWTVRDKQPVFILEYSTDPITYTGNSYCVAGEIDIYNDGTDDKQRAEVFTISGTKSVTQVDFYVKKVGTPGSPLEYWIFDNTDSAHVVSGTLSPTTDYGWVSSASISATLTDTHEYSLCLKYAGTDGSTLNYYKCDMPHSNEAAEPYGTVTWGGTTNKTYYTNDGGGSWTSEGKRDAAFRFTLGGAIKIIIQKWRELYH